MNKREQRAKRNIIVSFLGQFILVLSGLIVPRVMLKSFGSEVYGATTSITQFLGYILILEGGIGGVAKAALYKPLAQSDFEKMSMIMSEIRRFFRGIAYVFAVHVLIMACIFRKISNFEALDFVSTFLLVIVISLSSFAEYFFGITNSVFLQADQKVYISNLLTYISTVLNVIMIILLTRLGCNIIIVKLCSSVVFALKPFYLYRYVKRHYKLTRISSKETLLKDKWVGLGQHLAYFLHNNTDVFILTLFSDLKNVAVYAVYFMVVSQIQKVATSFSSGMESVFGDMYARKETETLQKTFGLYETLISIVSVILFSVTAIMIVPFEKIYTAGMTDANYIRPLFAIVLVVATLLTQLSTPYSVMAISAGHFRQTRVGAYGEAIINIIVSIALVWKLGLIGVAIGTVVATLFRFVYYAVYLSKNILSRPIHLFFKRSAINFSAFAVLVLGMDYLLKFIGINDFFFLVMVAGGVTILSVMVTLIINFVFYKQDCLTLLKKVTHSKNPS